MDRQRSISVMQKYHEIFKILDYHLMYSNHLATFVCMQIFLCVCVLLSPKLAFHYARIEIYNIKKYFVGAPSGGG